VYSLEDHIFCLLFTSWDYSCLIFFH